MTLAALRNELIVVAMASVILGAPIDDLPCWHRLHINHGVLGLMIWLHTL
jgi:hypothetical protein